MAPDLEGRLQRRTARQRRNVLAVTVESGQRVEQQVQDTVARDTSYMADHTRLEITHEGNGYRVGWRAPDFVGKTNPVSGRRITSFYPRFVVFGTRFMAGRDPLTPALEAERPRYRRSVARALSN
jgi:hypothetical protein